MNSKFIASAVIALSALAGASAFAQSSLNPEAALAIRPDTSTSMSNAQVQNNYSNAGQNGDAAANAWARNQAATSDLSRAAVRSEAVMSARTNLSGNSSI